MVVVVEWKCAVVMVFRATNIVWSTAMAYHRKVPETFCTYSVDLASNIYSVLVSSYWLVAPYKVWFHRCEASFGFLVALCWNLRRAASTYPSMETRTFMLT